MGKADEAVGCCKEAVVKLDPTLALVCLILNCIPFTTSLGTMISACAGKEFKCNTLAIGFAQFFTAWLLVGYIWAIIHGIWLYKAAQ